MCTHMNECRTRPYCMDRHVGIDTAIVLLRILRKLSWTFSTFSFYELENIEYLSVPLIARSQNDCKKPFLPLERHSCITELQVLLQKNLRANSFAPLEVLSLPLLYWISIVSFLLLEVQWLSTMYFGLDLSLYFFPEERSEVSSLYFRHFPPIISLNTFFTVHSEYQ